MLRRILPSEGLRDMYQQVFLKIFNYEDSDLLIYEILYIEILCNIQDVILFLKKIDALSFL